MSSKIDWPKVTAALPYQRSAKAEALRNEMWAKFDVNGNGKLSLAELDKAMRDVLNVDALFECKPAIARAFNAARAVDNKAPSASDNYIERSEFRVFLESLRQYFEYFQAFDRIDTSGDRRIEEAEFIKALPSLVKWVGVVADPKAEFKKIAGTNKHILFDDFCKWAFARKLDLDDDDD